MNVVIDTSVWSLALRSRNLSVAVEAFALAELIREGRTAMLGPVRQELLSGVPDPERYETLREYLRAFPDVDLEVEDYEVAASFFSNCRRKGVQGSNTDFLICAVATRRRFEILTSDADFHHFAKILPIHLHVPASRRR